MTKKKRCPVCGQDITNRAYIGIVYNGRVAKCCPKCADEVLKNGKKNNGVNRSLNSNNVSIRKH